MINRAIPTGFLGGLPWSVGRRVRIKHVLNAIELLPPQQTILDAGCGDGRLAAMVAHKYPDSKVLACDIDEHSIKYARLAGDKRSNLRLRTTAIGGDLLDETFDLVICVDVLEHILDDRGAIQWLAAHMSPGAFVVLHVPASPQHHWLQSVDQAMKAELKAGRGPHVREGYRPEDLRALANECGLTDIRIEFTFHRGLTQFAADLDTWTYLRGARLIKAMLLPGLLLAGAIEARGSSSSVGNGLLLTARARGDIPL
jgi:2-polyprenyl-3-methyl-5-hydroxy-6-metoxy-1,4-benzoquinol methylase